MILGRVLVQGCMILNSFGMILFSGQDFYISDKFLVSELESYPFSLDKSTIQTWNSDCYFISIHDVFIISAENNRFKSLNHYFHKYLIDSIEITCF